MERGTTPTHIFNIPSDIASAVKEVKVVYSQNDSIILEKRTDACTIEGSRIIIKLSQEETFLFDCTKLAYIQVRVLTHSCECLKSKVMVESVGKCLDEEVLE